MAGIPYRIYTKMNDPQRSITKYHNNKCQYIHSNYLRCFTLKIDRMQILSEFMKMWKQLD